MMIPLKHLNALDVISVLLFSLLANFILPLRIDFTADFDFVELARLVLLSVSSILFYTVVSHLKDIAGYSRAEYEAETSVTEKASRSIEVRYQDYCRADGHRSTLAIGIAIACGGAFFLVQPIVDVLR
jgi:hypothetical protein